MTTTTYQPNDLFYNHDTYEVHTYYELTTYETENDEENLMNYFNDLLNDEILEQIYEVRDENNGRLLGYQNEEGTAVSLELVRNI